MTVEQVLLNNPTTPISNKDRNHKFCHWYLQLCSDVHGKVFIECKRDDLVKIHKKQLGQQKYCWNGEFKFWIWEFLEDKDMLRVYVNNHKGICLETTPHTSFSRALELAENYRKKLLGK